MALQWLQTDSGFRRNNVGGFDVSKSLLSAMGRLCICLCTAFLLAAAASPAADAHFQLKINIRIIHVEHLKDCLRVLIRLPMPYVVAKLVGAERPDGTRTLAP